ncbi:MFS transporter [Gynuella sp.]|uniref:MFS transporter n=1 Tax=Gynuella sp. TaxID=2969146 RepID=UPI003D12D3CF
MNTEATPSQSIHNARLIVLARLISDFGAFLNMVALSTYVYMLSNSAMSIGIFLACRVAGGITAGIVGTPFFRHWTGKIPLICFDLLRAFLVLLLLIVPTQQQLLLLPVIAFGIGFGHSMFSIGLNSQMPRLINAEHRVNANAWITSAASSGAVVGSLISGLLVAGFGYQLVFAINITTYIVATMFILPLRMLSIRRTAEFPHLRQDWIQLRHGLKAAPLMAGMLLVTMMDTLGSAAHNVGFPILSKLLTPESASTTMGLLLAVWACGKFAGARIASRILKTNQLRSMEKTFFFGVLAMSGGFILVFQQSELVWLLCAAIPAGLGDGLAEVGLVSRLQQEPDQLRLPAFSLLTVLQMSGFGIGMLISAPFYEFWAPAHVVLVFHGLPILTAILVLWRWSGINRYGNEPAERESVN